MTDEGARRLAVAVLELAARDASAGQLGAAARPGLPFPEGRVGPWYFDACALELCADLAGLDPRRVLRALATLTNRSDGRRQDVLRA